MEIRIKAIEMLRVLVHAGIETNDAKAIIFDLLQNSEKGLYQPKDAESKRGRKKKTPDADEAPVEDAGDGVSNESDETGNDEIVDGPVESAGESETAIKHRKRISFRNFGGSAMQPIAAKK